MRRSTALAAAALSVGALVPVQLARSAAPAGAAVPCAQELRAGTRYEYPLKNGSRTLGFGQIVVQQTKADANVYCVRMQTGGRTVTFGFGDSTEARRNEECTTQLGARGDSGGTTSGYNTAIVVEPHRCEYKSFSIRSGGEWWSARVMRYRN